LQGASAIEKILEEERNPNIRVFVVWEPVLPTDLGAPSTATLRRVSDPRASQYWDKGHLISRLLGEQDRTSVVWDYVAVYQPGTLWDKAPPRPLYSHDPVVRSVEGTKGAIRQALRQLAPKLASDVRLGQNTIEAARDQLWLSSTGSPHWVGSVMANDCGILPRPVDAPRTPRCLLLEDLGRTEGGRSA